MEELLPNLTDEQYSALTKLLEKSGLNIEIHSANPGTYSYDLSVSVDHEELMAALSNQKAYEERSSRLIRILNVRRGMVSIIEDGKRVHFTHPDLSEFEGGSVVLTGSNELRTIIGRQSIGIAERLAPIERTDKSAISAALQNRNRAPDFIDS